MIPADKAQVLLLDRMLEEIRELRRQSVETLELVKQQIPEGMVEPLHTKTATTTPQNIMLRKRFFSIVLINDGPNDCWIIVNTEKSSTTPFKLKVGEVQEVDMKTAQIEDMRFYTDEGTAEIRVRGVR